MERVDILAIAAHPDDVELSCAGTMLLAKQAGYRTAIIDLTRGELSTRGTLESRAKETAEATKILRLDHRENLGLPDGNIELSKENVTLLVRVLRQLRPTILLTPHRFERHPDHEAASELAHRALFSAGLAKVESKVKGEKLAPHRPVLTLHYMQTYSFEPKIIIDVSDVFEDRMAAMHAYDSQFSRSKLVSPRVGTEAETPEDKEAVDQDPQTFLSQAGFYEWIEARARSYGMLIGVEFGEPFWSHEPLGTKDIFSLVTKKVA
jgi:N-acetylglucosamine malate deacetylase 1